MKTSLLGLLTCCFMLLPGAISASHAQDAGGSSEQSSKGQSQEQEPTFRLNVRLVNVFTTVTDSRGAPVANLTKDDFRIFEDGKPQTISVFDKESEMPLSIVLEVDTSE